ncbi:MAG: MoaD family protein [Candidatus Bathyarchaeota archaeon]|nr:MoaD family protein [Candidatus Bathyarchaeota archaeon]
MRLFTMLRELAQKGDETLEFDVGFVTVKDVLEELVRRHGKEFKDYLYDEKRRVREHLQLLVNGKSVSLSEGLETRLREGDEVAIVPPVGGG